MRFFSAWYRWHDIHISVIDESSDLKENNTTLGKKQSQNYLIFHDLCFEVLLWCIFRPVRNVATNACTSFSCNLHRKLNHRLTWSGREALLSNPLLTEGPVRSDSVGPSPHRISNVYKDSNSPLFDSSSGNFFLLVPIQIFLSCILYL